MVYAGTNTLTDMGLVQIFDYEMEYCNYQISGLITSISLTISVVVSYVIALVVFLVLPMVSHCLYERHIRMVNTTNAKHTLSARYQLSTNVSDAKLLNKIVLFMCITSLTSLSLFSLSNYINGAYSARVIYEFFNLSITLQPMILCFVMFRSKDRLHRELCRMLCCIKKKRIDFIPKAVDGRVLVIPVKDERRLYFDMYDRYWR
ncbi:unnamed protein product [Anisakis simplex]|uniref:G_PROTEIN_RECEP_F1_2 domain-containing protein n=1 Tax=Anisakis simplex TaxID=6269 RepID=A0A0M3KAF0_ANISI|nr:unnamed protein product [Anisakis simplex]